MRVIQSAAFLYLLLLFCNVYIASSFVASLYRTAMWPQGGVTLASDGFLYGSGSIAGRWNQGVIYKMAVNGSNFSVLHDFGTYGPENPQSPLGSLIELNDYFWGISHNGGAYDKGTVYSITKSGVATIHHHFNGSFTSSSSPIFNSNGASPASGLTLGNGNWLHGATAYGGLYGNGAIYRIDPATDTFETLYSFKGQVNGDGSSPLARPIFGSDGNLYGTTQSGGNGNYGTIYQIAFPSKTYTQLHKFSCCINDGQFPVQSSLLEISTGVFIGSTQQGGGSSGVGVIYKIIPSLGADNNYGYGIIFRFDNNPSAYGSKPSMPIFKRSDGNLYLFMDSGGVANYGGILQFSATTLNQSFVTINNPTLVYNFSAFQFNTQTPRGEMIEASVNNLIGTTERGGATDKGSIFSLSVSDSVGTLNTLYSFSSPSGAPQGQSLFATPTLHVDGYYYACTVAGGLYDSGSVVKISQSGVLTVLAYFDAAKNESKECYSELLWHPSDEAFWGTSKYGGVSNEGTVFRVTLDGVFTVMKSFRASGTGVRPQSGLILAADGTTMVGVTPGGGVYGYGVLYSITTAGVYSTIFNFDNGQLRNPLGTPLLAADGNYYGAVDAGGSSSNGGIYRVTPAGVYSNIYSFTGGINGGSQCTSALIQASSGSLFGTCKAGGANNVGIIYRLSTSAFFQLLYSFSGVTNGDGCNPTSAVYLHSNAYLYGSTTNCGNNNSGMLFRINPANISSYEKIYSFPPIDYGTQPSAVRVNSAGELYGGLQAGTETTKGGMFTYLLGECPANYYCKDKIYYGKQACPAGTTSPVDSSQLSNCTVASSSSSYSSSSSSLISSSSLSSSALNSAALSSSASSSAISPSSSSSAQPNSMISSMNNLVSSTSHSSSPVISSVSSSAGSTGTSSQSTTQRVSSASNSMTSSSSYNLIRSSSSSSSPSSEGISSTGGNKINNAHVTANITDLSVVLISLAVLIYGLHN